MKVFLSWSGGLSRSLAVELRDWLPMVVHHVDPWLSSRDIQPGDRWAFVLGRELEDSNFGILCVTRENLDSPWLLFEAGAVARSLGAKVVPVLLGMKADDLRGPLAQFQAVVADQEGLKNLVSVLFESTGSGLEDHQKKLVFEHLWPLMAGRLDELSRQARSPAQLESADDVLADLASTTRVKGGAETLLSGEVLKRFQTLAAEQERHRQELEYLRAEEVKLTEQDAPISLVERAIEPTERRLERVQAKVNNVLDTVLELLTASQREILSDLTTFEHDRRYHVAAEDRDDVDRLAQLGLVRVEERGAVVGHPLVAEYFRLRDADSSVNPGLTGSAAELLLEASKDSGGVIMRVDTFEGSHVQTNGRDFVEKQSVRSAARWRSALEELETAGLVEDRVGKGEVFFVTDPGYRAAEAGALGAAVRADPPGVP